MHLSGVEYMKQINESEVHATAAYDESGNLVYMTKLEDVAKFVGIPAPVINKAMPHRIYIQKYHK